MLALPGAARDSAPSRPSSFTRRKWRACPDDDDIGRESAMPPPTPRAVMTARSTPLPECRHSGIHRSRLGWRVTRLRRAMECTVRALGDRRVLAKPDQAQSCRLSSLSSSATDQHRKRPRPVSPRSLQVPFFCRFWSVVPSRQRASAQFADKCAHGAGGESRHAPYPQIFRLGGKKVRDRQGG